ncbi:MAG TPA: hypothetical protein EYG04_04535, partial [Candidatus Poseidoniales archaeon]|nr:hypothetical protein [Candidatus Poseidoniales archaeon]
MAKRSVDSFEDIVAKGMSEFGKIDEKAQPTDAETVANEISASKPAIGSQKAKEITRALKVEEHRTEFIVRSQNKPIKEKKELAKVWPPPKPESEEGDEDVFSENEVEQEITEVGGDELVESDLVTQEAGDISSLTDEADSMVAATPVMSHDLLLSTTLPKAPMAAPPAGPPAAPPAGPP